MKCAHGMVALVLLGGGMSGPAAAGDEAVETRPPRLFDQTRTCIACHKDRNPGLYQQWGQSRHYRANVGCYECHQAEPGEPDARKHFGTVMATLVTPADCGRCHATQAGEFLDSRRAKAVREFQQRYEKPPE